MKADGHHRAIDDIRIGPRHRKALGDIQALALNIAEVGLLHPIVITDEGELIAGRRRLEACRSLGWTLVPVTVVPLDDVLKGQWSENVMRKDFTRSEAVAIGRALEERERALAKERQAEGGRHGGEASGDLPEASKGETRDRIGIAIGMSGSTYQKAKAVVEAAEEDPETFGPVAAEMDVTGNVESNTMV